MRGWPRWPGVEKPARSSGIWIRDAGCCMFVGVPEAAVPGGPGWLTLHEASERLDVHPATLRQWADRGRVRAFRTPGGHRRFSAEDVDTLLATLSSAPSPEVQLL